MLGYCQLLSLDVVTISCYLLMLLSATSRYGYSPYMQVEYACVCAVCEYIRFRVDQLTDHQNDHGGNGSMHGRFGQDSPASSAESSRFTRTVSHLGWDLHVKVVSATHIALF